MSSAWSFPSDPGLALRRGNRSPRMVAADEVSQGPQGTALLLPLHPRREPTARPQVPRDGSSGRRRAAEAH